MLRKPLLKFKINFEGRQRLERLNDVGKIKVQKKIP